MRAATVVQVLQDLFHVLLHVLFYLWSLLKTNWSPAARRQLMLGWWCSFCFNMSPLSRYVGGRPAAFATWDCQYPDGLYCNNLQINEGTCQSYTSIYRHQSAPATAQPLYTAAVCTSSLGSYYLRPGLLWLRGSTMTVTIHDDQLGEIYPAMLDELNCTFGVSFSRFHCCGRHGHDFWPSWYRAGGIIMITSVSLFVGWFVSLSYPEKYKTDFHEIWHRCLLFSICAK